MKKGITINQAIIEALKKEGKPLRVGEIYKRIIEDDLYRFKAANPEHIVRTQLRRHSVNLNFPTAKKSKHFLFLPDGNYWIKSIPHSEVKFKEESISRKDVIRFDEIKKLHNTYLSDFKKSLLEQIIKLDTYEFEHFCKKLLSVYGFNKLKVTPKTKDGGIDGFGELKIGLVALPVAFECKRWRKTVGRPKIDQFRGSIVGNYQQGIFFTTSQFSKDAKLASFKIGAPPIILVDGKGIVDMMIEKRFGIEIEELPIYTNALDLILQNDK